MVDQNPKIETRLIGSARKKGHINSKCYKSKNKNNSTIDKKGKQ